MALVAALAALLLGPNAFAQGEEGWQRTSLPGGSYAQRYVPPGVSLPAPTVLFLHGAGGTPELYQRFLEPAADAAGLVVVAPKSVADLGWGFGDDPRVLNESLDWAADQGVADLERLTAAGHSAGAAYAYLLTYQAGLPARAVFILASPFYPVSAPLAADPPPPIRMYYGHNDPNYTTAYPRLVDQWTRLGVPWEADLRAGFGHGTWPRGTVEAGFAFLAAASEAAPDGCVPSETVLCLGNGRFQVEVEWQDFDGVLGDGRVVEGLGAGSGGSGGGGSGLFWFFREDNWELMVKVLDGCAVNRYRWVFSAATTNVAYTLTVLDTESGALWRHENRAGEPAPAVTDTTAFPCQP